MKLTNPEVRIETTNICNATCIMCPREKMDRLEGIMDMDLFKRIVDECKDLGATSVFLGGFGEPLMDDLLVDRVRYVKQRNMFCNFISNGSLWNEEAARGFIDAGLDEIRFSFYGQDKETYEEVHRGLNYEITRKNIYKLIDLRKTMGSKTPTILVYFLNLSQNEEHQDSFRAEWEPVADFIEIWKPHNFTDGRDYRGLNVPRKKESCGRPKKGPIQFQYDGTMIPCCYDYAGKVVLGDYNEQSIPEILKGKEYEALRQAHEKEDYSDQPLCDNCDQLLEHADALVYTNRHNLPAEEAVLLTNSNHYQLK
ncbi:MAG: radical SAM/SPASM domain-containing protein [Nitrospinota bacterium]|nr:radical SAM/SPASM domain-containing protein [Nitrospinota bacterium]